MTKAETLITIVPEIAAELNRARTKHPRWHSAHEGLAILMEEFEELKDHVFTKEEARDYTAMKYEAIQVAAMAIRFIEDCCL